MLLDVIGFGCCEIVLTCLPAFKDDNHCHTEADQPDCRLAVIQATGKYKAWPWGPAKPSPISDVLLAFKGSNILLGLKLCGGTISH